MPLFEFVCSDCGQMFEELVRSASNLEGVICPVCAGSQVKKRMSRVAARITGGGSMTMSAPAASCNTGGT